VELILSPEDETVLAVTLFHTLFNLLGVILFIPFIGLLAKLLQRLYPEKASVTLQFLSQVTPNLPEAAVIAAKKESLHGLELTMKFIFKLLHLEKIKEKKGLLSSLFIREAKEQTTLQLFEEIQLLNKSILVFTSKISTDPLEESEKKELNHAIQMTMATAQASKTMMSIETELQELDHSEHAGVNTLLKQIRNLTKEHLMHLQEVITTPVSKQSHDILQQKIKQDYKGIVTSITEHINLKSIDEKEASSLLMINGFMTQTVRHLFRILEKTH
jgi:phosphate:Na+ symporter